MLATAKGNDVKLIDIASIRTGYQSRSRIIPVAAGSHYLLQSGDLREEIASIGIESLTRFNPILSKNDWELKANDILLMARGTMNTATLLKNLPEHTLAAASFFIVRSKEKGVIPEYLVWYLNQKPVQYYLIRESGAGVQMRVIRRQVLEQTEIPLPNMETQHSITSVITAMTEEQTLLSKLAAKRHTLFTELCLKTINNDIKKDQRKLKHLPPAESSKAIKTPEGRRNV